MFLPSGKQGCGQRPVSSDPEPPSVSMSLSTSDGGGRSPSGWEMRPRGMYSQDRHRLLWGNHTN